MDNYEHLPGGIELLSDILASAPRVKLLVTSRERLNVQEEWALPIQGLPFPPHEANGDLCDYSAIQLFMESARRVQPGFALDGNRAGVIDICEAVGGMPLGIELAATWLRAMPCDQIAKQIRHDLDFLSTPLRNVPVRHRSLRAVFEHSWSLLSDAERDVLMRLSVFRGGFDAEGARQVTGASLPLLASLVDKSLIQFTTSGRYEMQELLRQFSEDKLTEANATATAQTAHFQFFLGLAEQLQTRLFKPEHMIAVDRLEMEHNNFRAALNWAYRTGEAESGLRMANALGWFWSSHAYFIEEGRDWLEKFRVASTHAPLTAHALAVAHLIELSNAVADYDCLSALHEEALSIARKVEDPWFTAWILVNLGGCLTATSHPLADRSRDFLEEALALFRSLDDIKGVYTTLSRLS